MPFRIYPLNDKGQYGAPLERHSGSVAEALTVTGDMAERLTGPFDLWRLGEFVGRYRLGDDGEAVPLSGGPAGPLE